MVELMTKNKALPGDSLDYHIYFPSIKARAYSRMQFPFGYFRSLTILGEDQRERQTDNAYEHESCTNYNILICLAGRTTTEGDLNSTHLKFCCSAMQSPSVGEVCKYPEVSSFHFNPYLVLELVLVPASCSIKKRKKKERSYRGNKFFINKTPW